MKKGTAGSGCTLSLPDLSNQLTKLQMPKFQTLSKRIKHRYGQELVQPRYGMHTKFDPTFIYKYGIPLFLTVAVIWVAGLLSVAWIPPVQPHTQPHACPWKRGRSGHSRFRAASLPRQPRRPTGDGASRWVPNFPAPAFGTVAAWPLPDSWHLCYGTRGHSTTIAYLHGTPTDTSCT